MNPAAGEICLWLCDLDTLDREALAANAALLDDAECARHAAFLRQEDRDRFLAGRALTRRVLADCLGGSASRLRFATGPYGRPHLAGEGDAAGPHALSFNLSHSGAVVALAVARGMAVGVDVERIGRATDHAGIGEVALTPAERATLAECPDADRPAAFIRLWTLKEAFSKAVGQGLSLDLQCFGVVPGREGRAILLPPPGENAADWTLLSPDIRPGYALALAIRNAGAPVHLRAPLDGNAVLRHDVAAVP